MTSDATLKSDGGGGDDGYVSSSWDYSSGGGESAVASGLRYLHTYAPPLLLAVGTVGNVLAALVLRRMYRHVLSTCLYVFVCVLVDTAVLYLLCGTLWVETMTGVNLRQVAMLASNSTCKMYPFVTDVLLHLSAWLLVALVTETTIIVTKPPRLLRMCNLERARAVILLIMVLVVCLNAHYFWTFALVKLDKSAASSREVCTAARQGNQHSEEFRKVVWPVLDVAAGDLVPYCVIFSCTVMMVTTRARRHDQVRDMETVWKSYALDCKSAKELQFGFLIICVCYLALLLPKLGYKIFYFLVHPNGLELVTYSNDLNDKLHFANAICYLLLYVFVSCKFIILTCTTRHFRQEVRGLFSCVCRRRAAAGPSPAAVAPGRPTYAQPLLVTPPPPPLPSPLYGEDDAAGGLSPDAQSRNQIYSTTAV